MDAGYLSALAGLAGAVIGGLTSFGTTWLTQSTQLRERTTDGARKLREKLYVDFSQEASRLLADALSHDTGTVENFAKIDAMLAHIRMVSPGDIVEAAEAVIVSILEAYSRPSPSLTELREFAANGGMDPLRSFAQLCREELASYRLDTQPALAGI